MARLSGLLNPSSAVLGANNAMTSASQPRASYFIPTWNTSNGSYQAMFLDSEFNKISYVTARPYYGSSASFDSLNQSYESTNQAFSSGIGGSETTQSSSSTLYLHGQWNTEFGCAMVRGSSRSVVTGVGTMIPTPSASVMASMGSSYVNSDHARKDLVIQLHSGALTSSPLNKPWDGRYGATTSISQSIRKYKLISSAFPSGTQITSMWGSASYNAVRKELVVMANNSNTTGRFDVAIWKNVDFNATDVDVSLLSNTPDKLWNITTPSFSNNDNEARYNIKVVLVDNGDIYYSIMYQNSSHAIYRIIRAGDDNSGSVSFLTNAGLTTSYGKDQGDAYGQKSMETREGSMVATYCPYYYYGSGLSSFVIDKRNSSYAAGRYDSSSSYGAHPVKYRDNAFAWARGQNYYADNYSATIMFGFTVPVAGGAPLTSTSAWYLPIAPQPNTTNYISLYHVWDYDLQTVPPAYSGRRA